MANPGLQELIAKTQATLAKHHRIFRAYLIILTNIKAKTRIGSNSMQVAHGGYKRRCICKGINTLHRFIQWFQPLFVYS